MNRSPAKRSIILAAALSAWVGAAPANGQTIYWTDVTVDKIQRASLDDRALEDVSPSGAVNPRAIVLNIAAGKMYFGGASLRKANLDGSQLENVLSARPAGIALDLIAGKLYWTDFGVDKIRRADLDGSNSEDLVDVGLDFPIGIALDLQEGKMYWTNTSPPRIQRANLDGSNLEDLITEDLITIGVLAPDGICLDTAEGKMYWTEATGSRIRRANLDGSSIELLVQPGGGTRGIALDVDAGKMYWAETGTGRIRRANLDGTEIEDVVTGLDNPVDIALDLSCAPGSVDCQPNGIPDDCEIVRGMAEDCNDNGVPDECDLSSGESQDCNSTGIPDECENDCNENGLADECDIADGTSDDCTSNGVPDECETDCNGNGTADSCDIADGISDDCNVNVIPDECEQDCNDNGAPDDCDISDGISDDCTNNGIPDECEPDCNNNGTGDTCDIADGTSEDCTSNGIPDECEPDCNENGVADSCDIAGPPGFGGAGAVSSDCDRNGVPDECDLSDGIDLPCAIIEFSPRGSTGPFEIDGNEMIIPEGGLQVEYEILVSGWGKAPGSPLLGAFNMVFEDDSLLGANADPPNPDVNLDTPGDIECTTATNCPDPDPPPVTESGTCGVLFPGYCDDYGGAFFLTTLCSGDLATPCRSGADCPPGADCIANPRYVFPPELAPRLFLWFLGSRFQWMGLSSIAYAGAEDPDGVSKFLVGNLRLMISEKARGTYGIRFFIGPDFTFINTPQAQPIASTVIHGRLTIGGACCLQDDVCEILLEGECEAAGGEFHGGFCGDDLDNDGTVDVCERCPTDNPDDTDGDGVLDDCDACVDSDLAELIVWDGSVLTAGDYGSWWSFVECPTGVPNRSLGDGCTMIDVLAECSVTHQSYDELTACVARHANAWRRQGLLSGKEVERIINCGGISNKPERSRHAKDAGSHGARLRSR